MAAASLTYRPELDGLRALAILAVLIFHSGAPFAIGGFLGVDIFFVLSGYLITTILVTEFDRTGGIRFKAFYIRRILRLAPGLMLLVTAVCVGSILFLKPDQAVANFKESLIAIFYFTNWSRAFGIHPPGVLGHTWSLSIEEQFYLLWPGTLLLLLKFTKGRGAVTRAVAYLVASIALLRLLLFMSGSSPERLYNGLDTRADALMTGCMLALWLRIDNAKRMTTNPLFLRLLKIAGPMSAVGLAIVFLKAHWSEPYMFYFGYCAIEVMSGILLLHALLNESSPIPRLLRTAPMVWIGTVSYGLYLYHYPIFHVLRASRVDYGTILIVGSVATFSLAALSFHYVEKPILKLKRHFAPAGAPKSVLANSPAPIACKAERTSHPAA